MSPSRPAFVPNRAPRAWWRWALLASLLAGVFLHMARPIWNGDYFWHVSSGRLYLETGSLPDTDPLTYTAGENVWVHHEWLAQVVLAKVESFVGLGGSRLFRSVLAATGFLVLFPIARRRHGFAPTLAILAAAWAGFAPNASLRPHLVTWPLAILLLAGLLPKLIRQLPHTRGTEVSSQGWAKLTLAIGLGLLLWVNLHSSALIVPLLLAAATAGIGAETLLGRLGTWRPVILLGSIAAAAALICLLQPAGWDLFRYALETPDVNLRSQEWAPLLSAGTWREAPGTMIFWWVLASGILLAKIAETRDPLGVNIDRVAAFWMAMTCLVLALQHRRMALFFFIPALFAMPPLWRWLARRGEGLEIRPLLLGVARWLLVALAASWALLGLGDAVLPEPIRDGLFPESAADLLVSADIQGRLFHDINWGGYLGYRRFPEQQVFADGRWLLAGPEAMTDFPRLYLRDLESEQIEAGFDKYQVEVLVQPTRDMLHLPGVDPDRWRLAWTDPVATILVRRGPSFDSNRRQLCELYRLFPGAAEQARWPVQVKRPDGGPSPTDVPSLIDLCSP